MGGGPVSVTTNVHNYAGVEVETKENRGAGGSLNQDIVIRQTRRAMDADRNRARPSTQHRVG